MQTAQPVSVVITNYNQGRFCDTALQSIVSQRLYNDNEKRQLIIVDDGSGDDSVEIIDGLINDKYASLDIQFIKKENGGTASARNAGARASKNDIICFLDIDDHYLPDKIIRSVEEINRYPSVGCVYTDYVETYLDGTRKITLKPPFDKEYLFHQCLVSTNSVYKRQALESIGGFDESIRKCEDYDSYLRMSVANIMIRHIPEILFVYNNHGQNKTATSDMSDWNKEETFIKDRAARGNYFIRNWD